MLTKRMFIRVAMPILVLLAATEVANAKRQEVPAAGELDFLRQRPEDRMQEWRDGFLKFMGEHQDLTSEQVQAIQNLADIDDINYFSYALDRNKRDLLSRYLVELGRVLSYSDYLKILRSFGELRIWLVRNELASAIETDTPVCNCGDSQDCSGGTCSNVTCIHEGGTSHSGRCSVSTDVE